MLCHTHRYPRNTGPEEPKAVDPSDQKPRVFNGQPHPERKADETCPPQIDRRKGKGAEDAGTERKGILNPNVATHAAGLQLSGCGDCLRLRRQNLSTQGLLFPHALVNVRTHG